MLVCAVSCMRSQVAIETIQFPFGIWVRIQRLGKPEYTNLPENVP